MYYLIKHLCPRTDIDMGQHGFTIDLHPKWKDLVARSDITQKECDHGILTLGDAWLTGCGFLDRMIYTFRDIRIKWGPWGLEHITVPGNACGLDIDGSSLGIFRGGASLLPHNIDAWRQKQLLLVIFCWFAETLVLQAVATNSLPA